MNILNELKKRGMINNITSIEKFTNENVSKKIYVGFDPTADSLHLGNYIQIRILKLFKKYGYDVWGLIGGATGMIGDPSGKSNERVLLNENDIKKNKQLISKQLKKFGLKVIDNKNFYKKMNILEFLRKIGKLININYILNKETIKNRIDNGISFTEFAYQLIQGWDFKTLYEKYGINIQLGGSDQWGNITTGIELIRKTIGDKNNALGITTNLLTTIDGKKIGKTNDGKILWLSPKKTSPFSLYQYLLNTTDNDVKKLLYWLTNIEIVDIEKLIKKHNKNKKKRIAQKTLAFYVTKEIHSLEFAEMSKNLSTKLFSKKNQLFSLEEKKNLKNSIPSLDTSGKIIDVLVKIGAASSKREAREFLTSGSISIDNNKITSENHYVSSKKPTLIKKGKKHFYLLIK